MVPAHFISISLATVMCMIIKPIFTSVFVRLFVHQEPQQIFMGINEYRANLVKARVNGLSAYTIPEGREGFTEPSNPSLEHHCSIDNQ